MATVPEKKKAGGHGQPCGPSTHPGSAGSLASCWELYFCSGGPGRRLFSISGFSLYFVVNKLCLLNLGWQEFCS